MGAHLNSMFGCFVRIFTESSLANKTLVCDCITEVGQYTLYITERKAEIMTTLLCCLPCTQKFRPPYLFHLEALRHYHGSTSVPSGRVKSCKLIDILKEKRKTHEKVTKVTVNISPKILSYRESKVYSQCNLPGKNPSGNILMIMVSALFTIKQIVYSRSSYCSQISMPC